MARETLGDRGAEERPAAARAWWAIDLLLSYAQTGVYIPLGQTREVPTPRYENDEMQDRVIGVTPQACQRVVALIENEVFDFASKSYGTLRYGEGLQDIWLDHRSAVEEKLQALGLSSHLEAITSGLTGDNPEEWRACLFACRNLLEDLANMLWLDPRDTYSPLLGSGSDGHLTVTQGHYKNRLAAYLHQKHLTGGVEALLRDEVDRLDQWIRSLTEAQSSGHSPTTKEQARAVALSTYFLVGQLVT